MRGSKVIERPLTASSKISPVLPPLDLPSISLAFLNPDPSEDSVQSNAIEHDSIDEELLDQREVDQEQFNYEQLDHDLVIQALLNQEQLNQSPLNQNRLSQGHPITQQLHQVQAEHAQINRAQTVQVELGHQQPSHKEFKEKHPNQEQLDQEKRNQKDVQGADTDLEMHEEASTQEIDLQWKAGRQEWLILTVLVIISLLAALDATVLVPVLPSIAYSLHGSATDTFWAGTSYLLANAVVQPFIAALSDIFGRRLFLFLSVLLFTVGTLICCLANDFTQLLAGRSVQGVGGGGIIVLVLVITTDIIPLRQRPKYNVVLQLSWAAGTVSGPLIGGVIAQNTTWRWIFYINFPFCTLSLIMIPFVIKLEMKRSSFWQKVGRVDWLGGVFFIASLTSFLVAITWGGIQFPWANYRTLVPLAVGVAGLIMAVAWERWVAQQPFLRLFLFNSRSAILAYICTTLQGLLLFIGLYYLPFYMESVKAMSPTMTGVSLVPITCIMLPVSMVVGFLMTKTGRFRWALWSGWIVMTIGNGLLILFDTRTATIKWVCIFVVLGLAHGLTLMPLIFGLQAMAETKDVAFAAAMYAFLRTFGQSVGVAIGGAVFQNLLAKHLKEANLPAAIATNAEGYVATLTSMPAADPIRLQIEQAFTLSFRGIFEVGVAISGFGLLCSLGVAHYSLDRHLGSTHLLTHPRTKDVANGIDQSRDNSGDQLRE